MKIYFKSYLVRNETIFLLEELANRTDYEIIRKNNSIKR